DVHLANAGHRRHDLVVQQEVRAEYTRDFELVLAVTGARAESVQRDRSADDARISAERTFPERMAQDDDGGLARRVLHAAQQAAVQRGGAEQRKQTRRGFERFDALWLVEAEQRA